jgi:uncharacterized protein (DUF4415 family)
MTRTEEKTRAHYHQMAEALRRLERALHGANRGEGAVPEAWHAIAQGAGAGRKVRVSLWLEADVLRFFRSMGAGHTTRMAEVLATFMHARLAGVVKGPEHVDYSRRPMDPDEAAYHAARDARWKELEENVGRVLGRE